MLFYDRISGAYDLVAEPSERRCRERGVDALGLMVGESVLEIGAGTGHGAAALRRRVGANGRVFGVDNSSGMLVTARRVLGPDPNATLVRGDARNLCVAPATFDAALLSFTLESFAAADMWRVLSEVHRALRPAGRVAVIALAKTADANAMTTLYEWIHQRFPSVADCRPIDAAAILRQAGFRVSREETVHIWGLRVAIVTAVKHRQATPFAGVAGPG